MHTHRNQHSTNLCLTLSSKWCSTSILTDRLHSTGIISVAMKMFSSVQSLSRVQLFATPWITAHQASLSITDSRSSLRLMSIKSVMPSSHLILCCLLLLLPTIPPSIRVFFNESTLPWGGQSTGGSALASFLPKKSQGWSPSEWTGWISLQSKDSQESSPTPQIKSINSSVLSLLHSPTLTSIHDHRKNHSLD